MADDAGADAGAGEAAADAEAAKGAAPADNANKDGTSQAAKPEDFVSAALEAGWTMAVLYGHLDERPEDLGHLPSENQMAPKDRIAVELTRLDCLLASIRTAFPNDHAVPGCGDLTAATAAGKTAEDLKAALEQFNIDLTGALACIGRDVQGGYQLGRSLRDTVSPPQTGAGRAYEVAGQFARTRVTTMQSWLRTSAPDLPKDSAVIVSGSLGKWAAFVAAGLGAPARGDDLPPSFGDLDEYLLRQGDVWINLLTGTETTDGLLTPEGYVMAAEAAVRRASRLILRVLRHYWGALVILGGALAAVLLFSIHLPGGAGKTWTQILSILSSLGVTAKGVGSTIGKLTQEGAKPVYVIESDEVKAWAVTSLPEVTIGPIKTAKLRAAGVGKSRALSRN